MNIGFEEARALAEKAFEDACTGTTLVITSITAFSYGWVFYASPREYLDEGDIKNFSFDGNGPFLITKTGETVFLPSARPPVFWLRRWEIENNQKSDLASRPEARFFASQELHLLFAEVLFRSQSDEIRIDIVRSEEAIECDFSFSYRKTSEEWTTVKKQHLFTALMFEHLKSMANVAYRQVIAIDQTQSGQFDIEFSGSSEAFKNCKANFALQAQFEPIENGTRAFLIAKLKSVNNEKQNY